MENCPAKKVVAGKASEGEVGEKTDWEGVGVGWGERNGKIVAVGRRRKDGKGDSGSEGRIEGTLEIR